MQKSAAESLGTLFHVTPATACRGRGLVLSAFLSVLRSEIYVKEQLRA